MIQVLRSLWNARFGLDRLLQRADGRVVGDLKGEDVGIFLIRGIDTEGDAPLNTLAREAQASLDKLDAHLVECMATVLLQRSGVGQRSEWGV